MTPMYIRDTHMCRMMYKNRINIKKGNQTHRIE